MNRHFIKSKVIGFSLFLPVVALAADSEGGGSVWSNLFWSILPFVVLVAVIYFVFRRQQRSPLAKQQQSYMARSEQHMERIEALMERLVTALEKRDRE